jgi:phage regulator Rha-like protein
MGKELTKIQSMIYEIREQKVMLDRDLAELYGVELRSLNQAVKRNIQRFPSDFMFQLTQAEYENLRSQFVISSSKSQDITSKNRHGGRRYLPYVFTEQGVAMLSTVLNSEIAIEININIMRAFVKMRHYVIPQSDKNAQIVELRQLLMLHIENTGNKLSEHDKAISQIIRALNNLIEQPPKTKRIGFHTA